MPTLEDAKHIVEAVTGWARPGPRQALALAAKDAPRAFRFKDDGKTPNNPLLPLLHYRQAVSLDPRFDPAAIFEVLFKRHGWVKSWRNGVYPFLHFHAGTHEVLGIARGRAKVEFGGAAGRALELAAGDVVVLPAGTGHRRLGASADLLVVGAYPDNGGAYDEARPRDGGIEVRRAAIARVKLPRLDPVRGRTGALGKIWRANPA